MTEAFPDSFDIIRDTLNLPDPTQKLLGIINDYPHLSTICDIVIIYSELVEQSPSQVDRLTSTLVNLKSSTGITVAAWNRLLNFEPLTIAQALDSELHDLLRSELVRFDNGPVAPSNHFLVASLLSAVAMKHSLCHSHIFSVAVHRGLHYDDARLGHDPAVHQSLVLGACLQLSMSGSYLCDPNGFNARQVLDAHQVLSGLERIKNVGVVTHPGGQRLLEITIQKARDDFKSNVDDSWSILFPQ